MNSESNNTTAERRTQIKEKTEKEAGESSAKELCNNNKHAREAYQQQLFHANKCVAHDTH